MKFKRLAAFTLAFVALGAGIAYASSPWGEYEGFTKVRVLINDREMNSEEVPAFAVNGRAVLPIRAAAESLQAIVKWDEKLKTASIYKPNVHMFVAQGIGRNDSLLTPFGKVTQYKKMNFVVSAQVDSLKTEIHSFKLELSAPDGTLIRSSDAVQTDGKESFWYTWPLEDVTFDMQGEYKLAFLVKPGASDPFISVSERTIISE